MPDRSFRYNFGDGYGGEWQKYWVWWTKKGFTDDAKEQPVALELPDGKEFHIELSSKSSFPQSIDTFTVRLHNVCCPNAKVGSTAIGYLESYVWQKDTHGNLTKPVRTVPTTGEMRDGLPPYWVALPSERSTDWGTFVILVFDHTEVTRLLLGSKSRLTFRWRGVGGVQKPTLKAKSLELHVVCR